MQSVVELKSRISFPLVEITIIIGLYLSRLHSFLLFHCLAELSSIIVACCVFTLGWNVRKLMENGYFLFLGIGYLFISVPDLIHALSYKGMGVFQGFDANLPTQLWLGARFMESLTLLISPYFIVRKIKGGYLFHIYLVATMVMLGAIFYSDLLPAAFVEDQGLTWFKKVSEYVISSLLLISLGLLLRHRSAFESNVFRYMVAAIAMTIVSELAFTFYVHVYGLSNLIGHYFKIGSVYFIYKAIVETGITRPISLLFRNLNEARDELEDRVQKRTAELEFANRSLTEEIEERKHMARALEKNMQMLQSLFELARTCFYLVSVNLHSPKVHVLYYFIDDLLMNPNSINAVIIAAWRQFLHVREVFFSYFVNGFRKNYEFQLGSGFNSIAHFLGPFHLLFQQRSRRRIQNLPGHLIIHITYDHSRAIQPGNDAEG